MSRPLKIIPPIKGTFNEILTRIADGHGVKKLQARTKSMAKPSPPPKKP
jgi:hypothetical protein